MEYAWYEKLLPIRNATGYSSASLHNASTANIFAENRFCCFAILLEHIAKIVVCGSSNKGIGQS